MLVDGLNDTGFIRKVAIATVPIKLNKRKLVSGQKSRSKKWVRMLGMVAEGRDGIGKEIYEQRMKTKTICLGTKSAERLSRSINFTSSWGKIHQFVKLAE